MSKLTTAQMIDQLGLEDTATSEDGYTVGYDHKGNLLMWKKDKEKPNIKDGNEFYLHYSSVKNDLWKINYHYVSMEEALKAHTKEKRTIVFVKNDVDRYRFVYGEYGHLHFGQIATDGYSLKELVEGKWIIEE
ncbi:hypothetical protein NDS46_31240 (plasmid) [Paenibacillus thiaminolyticus]|uniref:hypothetical protein n=1 Tax=Paenibacillus thiaminolyticus TaxID=49283 RepID=UPI00232C7533|nr:hypothetical protein [Paenibacillus thiaminolyticus]WCF11434.1 hypothetical protein NDS46_31240 [Paenibacillus thiaminolyticus]